MAFAPRKLNKCSFINRFQQVITPGDIVICAINGYRLNLVKGTYLGCTPSGRAVIKTRGTYKKDALCYKYLINNELFLWANMPVKDSEYTST